MSFSSRPALPSIGRGRVDVDHFRLDPAGMRRQQQDAVADLDRLGDRVGHEQHGELRLVPQLQQFVLAGAAASARRARRRARPSAGCPAPSPCRGQWRRAASCRPTACADRLSTARVRLTFSMIVAGLLLGLARATGRGRLTSGNVTFSSTVFQGSSWSNSWNTIMRSGPGSVTLRPLMVIVPSLGSM